MSAEPLYIDDDDRYSRLRLIAWWDQEKLRRARVLVVGAGALGNEVLKNLALLGVGQVFIIDLDDIEDSNLSRSVLFRARDRGRSKAHAAAAAVHDLNPDTRVVAYRGNVLADLGLGLFRDVDVVIAGLDNREARLWVNRCCWKVGTPWVDGGIQEINGVVKVFLPPDGACYECGMTENDYRLINLRYSCPLLSREEIQAGKTPTAPTIASLIGGLQVQEALKLIHGMPVNGGQALVFNGVANSFYNTRFQRREDCLSHETYPPAIELDLSAERHTAAELFSAAREFFPETPAAGALLISLDRDLITALVCPDCGERRRIFRPQALVRHQEARCNQCGGNCRPEMIHTISSNGEHAREKLAAMGIPPYDLVRVMNGRSERVFLLAADREAVYRGQTEPAL